MAEGNMDSTQEQPCKAPERGLPRIATFAGILLLASVPGRGEEAVDFAHMAEIPEAEAQADLTVDEAPLTDRTLVFATAYKTSDPQRGVAVYLAIGRYTLEKDHDAQVDYFFYIPAKNPHPWDSGHRHPAMEA